MKNKDRNLTQQIINTFEHCISYYCSNCPLQNSDQCDKSWDDTVMIPADLAREVLTLLKEQAMSKPTKCPCGELFDAKDSSFCSKCGCAYGELSGRYTNIGR